MEPSQMDDTSSPPANSPPMSDTSAHQPTHRSFRSSVGLIPSPGTISKRHPTYVRPASIGVELRMLAHLKITQEPVLLQFWVVVLGCTLLTILGVVLEVTLRISTNNGGAERVIWDLAWY